MQKNLSSCSTKNEQIFTVFVGGIPKSMDVKIINDYLLKISNNAKPHVIISKKKLTRGFAFLEFFTSEDAELFISQVHTIEGHTLHCKFSPNHDDYI